MHSGWVARQFTSDRTWSFEVGLERLWAALTEVEEYRRWWPWLRRFDADGGFTAQSLWTCQVAPPLPYAVDFTVALEHVEPQHGAVATVRGGVTGRAELALSGTSTTSSARLRSWLTPADPIMRRFASLAPPLVQWGHDWVLEQGRRQFESRGLGDARR